MDASTQTRLSTYSVTVELEDHGQDFLEFDIAGGRIVQTRPFQGDVWNGLRVANRALAAGDKIRLCIPGMKKMSLKYPVSAVRALDRVRIGATDV